MHTRRPSLTTLSCFPDRVGHSPSIYMNSENKDETFLQCQVHLGEQHP